MRRVVAGDFRIDTGGHLRFAVFANPGMGGIPRRLGGVARTLRKGQVEGDAGTSDFTFTVSRNNNATAFAVTAASAPGGANPATVGSDYSALAPIVLNFAAGGALSQTVSVTVNGDTESEFSETFLVNLSGATNGAIITDGEGLEPFTGGLA